MEPSRLKALPRTEAAGRPALVARGARARLLGLAGLREPPPVALLIPRCRCVHTFGMRFALDLVWIGPDGRVLRVDRALPARRVAACRGAVAVLEMAARCDDAPMAEDPRQRMRAALDPRTRIHRDPFNELFVLVLSASGAAVIAPVLLYLAMAVTEMWAWWVFVLGCVAIELILIFGVGRPAMKPHERVGWALLWGTSAALLGAAFYYLVADSTL